MARPNGLPPEYNLSRHFSDLNESVEVYTDGENLIFVNYRLDKELGWFPQTISTPVRIGNVE